MKKPINEFVGKNISGISRVCDLVCMQFGSSDNLALHIQSFFRIVQKEKILISSDDMLRCDPKYDNNTFEWDIPGNSVFDISIEKHRDLLYNSKVLRVSRNKIGDLTIVFENDLKLQIIIDTIDKEEKYRITTNDKHIVFNS